jgi:hypothetical protein
MKIAYLILAHKNPQQLSRLISRLNKDGVYFSIHISLTASVPLDEFKKQIGSSFPDSNNIRFIDERYRGTWGSSDLIKTSIALIRSVLKFEVDSLVLISGQDYPIKRSKDFYELLAANKGKIFMEYKEVDWPKNKINRMNSYFFPEIFNFGKELNPPILSRLITRILPRRKFVEGMKLYTGRYWCILPFRFCSQDV